MLQEGHCMRDQVLNICSDKQAVNKIANFEFKAGNIETLKRMVDLQQGLTLLPELSTHDLTSAKKLRLRYFKTPEPVREISIVTHKNFIKKSIIEHLADSIKKAVPEKMLNTSRKKIVSL
jgi:LysR family hydrogen peroxide-inducible transcriptional activator